jgi:choline dehydrogenase-like flavoprotein
MTKKDEAVYIQIGEERIELTGEAKELLLAEQAKEINDKELLEAEYQAKRDARESAIKKLAEIAGLTEEELASIL